MQQVRSTPARRLMKAAIGVLLVLLAMHVAGVGMDWLVAVHYPFQFDYGEGIVWQQAELMPGPRAYQAPDGFPIIVFHYPPLFYILAKAALAFEPDLLAAGRLASMVCTALIAPLTAVVVLQVGRIAGQKTVPLQVALAVVAGLLPLSLYTFRAWGMLMRVDMPSIMLPLLAFLVFMWGNGRFWATVAALVLCTAAVFAKQTQVTAGIAVFLVGVWRHPRPMIGAAVLVGAMGLGVVAWLQVLTDGGFLANIVGGNVNRFSVQHVFWVFWPERLGVLVFPLGAVAGLTVMGGLLPSWRSGAAGIARDMRSIPLHDANTTGRALLSVYFILNTLMLFTVFKSGASFNYMLAWLSSGCTLIGVWMMDLARAAAGPSRTLAEILAALILTVGVQPLRILPNHPDLQHGEELVAQIAAATKPVASDDMVFLLRAGKPVLFEPAIVTELAEMGRWDERPLLDMIKNKGFAFFLIDPTMTSRRTEAVTQAMRAAYPREERVAPNLSLLWPADDAHGTAQTPPTSPPKS